MGQPQGLRSLPLPLLVSAAALVVAMSATVVTEQQNVPRAPEFTRRFLKHVVKPAGNMLRLKCHASGIPSPNITWLFDGEKQERQVGEFRYSRWSLLLEDLVISDSGNYTCIVCNELGCINFTYRVEVVERVLHRPILIEPPRNTTTMVGANITFTCRALSDLQLHLDWFRGYHTVPNEKYLVKSGFHNSNSEMLQLHNVTYDDDGWYTCIASNSLGTTYAMAFLHVIYVKS